MAEERGPSLTVDAVIEFPEEKVVLIRRKNPPFEGMWALPGGFVDFGETVEHACVREVKEECSIDVGLEGILGVYSDPKRDPRGHTVSVIFRARYVDGELKGADDAKEARLFSRDELKGIELAFDHGEVLRDAGWRRV
jgi:8-oxo-dGTP diphosphatase